MKKLTDYYVLITENIVDEVLTFLDYPKNANIINHYLVFGYDDVNSKHVVRVVNSKHVVRGVNSNKRTKLKWSKMKRFIENSPTREKYLSAQQQSKGYKKCWLEEKQRRELVGQNFDALLQEKKDLEFSNFKLKNRVERLVTERDGLVKIAKENGLTNKQTLTDWINSILESNKSKSNTIVNLNRSFNEYCKVAHQIKDSRNKYYKETQELQKVVEASNIAQDFLNQENKRLKRRNRILTIGFILSASFYLIASIF